MPVLEKNNTALVAKYDEFIRHSPYAVATQDRAWAEVKEGWMNEQVYVERDGKIVGALSLLIKKVIGNCCMLYAPRGPVCDMKDGETVMALVNETEALAKKYNAFMLRFDPEIGMDDEIENYYKKQGLLVRNRGFGKTELIQPRYNMILPIGGKTEEELMKGFSQKTRYNIRVAKKNGVTVRFSRQEADLKRFYEIYRITCERDKIGSRPYRYFEAMLHAYGENCRVYLTEHEGDTLSGAIALSYGKKMWYIYGASSNEKRNLMPNYAMQMEMIRWGLEEKKELYDFGGGVFHLTKEDGLYKFKEGFCRQQGVTEFIGEFDKVYNPAMYFGFTRVLPALKKLKSRLRKR